MIHDEIHQDEVTEIKIEKSEIANPNEVASLMKSKGMNSFFSNDEKFSSHLVSLGYKRDAVKDDKNARQWKS